MSFSNRIRRFAGPRARRLLLLAAFVGCGGGDDAPQPAAPGAAERPGSLEERPATLEEWEAQRERLDQTVWADERLAQEHERTIVALWDALLAAGRRGDESAKRAALAGVALDELRIGAPRPVEELDHGIVRHDFGGPQRSLAPRDWAQLLDELGNEGYRLVQTDWHHARFTPPEAASPARSQISLNLHLVDPTRDRRLAVEGELGVEWSGRRDAEGRPIAAKIDATRLRLLTRSGPPAFEEILAYEWPADGGTPSRLHPVLVYDLDRDGRSEIVALGAARVLWNRGGGRFEDAPLVDHPVQFAETGVVADLDGDGHPDLLAPRARGDLVLYRGDGKGRFPGEPRSTPSFAEPLRAPSALSVGDVDGDGDLDAWLAQYEPAYRGGQMPTPFYDANDGHPSYLLLNDGDGSFREATEAAGLGPKRFRRSYAASFVDLDEDGDLDLLVVSDYSGVDLHHNDGRGSFRDANDTLRADRHLFGMSASFADFDLDGQLDFFVAGMASTTARRLEALGLGRPDRPEIQEMRMRMAFGNRMYLARDDGWREPEFREQVARTGWTWGTTALDFDNDGDPDLFAANGHASGESTTDYCSTFWTHDIYDGASEPDPELGRLFAEIGGPVAQGRHSWDGYQKKQLLMNRAGKGFVNVAFLLGLAEEWDGRSALGDDLDLDGKVDLVLVEDHGEKGQKLHVYRNRLETGNAWIGVRLREEGGGFSPVGASVVVRTPERAHVGRIATGETLMGQHPTTLHFGLGRGVRVESIEVRWADGGTRVIRDPELGRTHLVVPEREG